MEKKRFESEEIIFTDDKDGTAVTLKIQVEIERPGPEKDKPEKAELEKRFKADDIMVWLENTGVFEDNNPVSGGLIRQIIELLISSRRAEIQRELEKDLGV